MDALTAFFNQNWRLLAMLIGAAVVVLLVASVVRRYLSGQGFQAKVPEGAIFVERETSGQRPSRWGSARNCLLVAVTPDALITRLHFPFTLMFIPEIYGLELSIPRSIIRHVRQHTGWYAAVVDVTFEISPGVEELMQFKLRQPERFLQALHEGRESEHGHEAAPEPQESSS